jgi:hypothetical protein
MSERKFKFVSPGVFIKEIDQSALPEAAQEIGPVVIGRSSRGPAMRPVTVSSFSEYVQTFGEPYSQASVSDPWRMGNKAGTTYGAYAAKAWLRNNGTLTFVRLLGKQGPDAASSATAATQAGWNTEEALGLWVFGSSSDGYHTGCLAGIFYRADSGVGVKLSGTYLDSTTFAHVVAETGAGNAAAIMAQAGSSAKDAEFKVIITGEVARASDSETTGQYVFNLNPNSKKFARNVFNTDPTRTNSTIYSNSSTTYKKYWLGETFEESLDAITGDDYFAIIGELANTGSGGGEQGSNFYYPSQKAESGWFIAQDLNESTGTFSAENQQKLFKLRSRDAGVWLQNNLKVSIENLRYGRISGSYGSFDVVLRKVNDTDNVKEIVERYSNCDLDPSSANYVARKIGDKYVSYDSVKLVNKEIGQYDNKSKFVYVQMRDEVNAGTTNPELLPFGVFGPLRYERGNYESGSNSFTDIAGNELNPFIALSGTVTTPATSSGGNRCYIGGASSIRFNFPEVPLRQSGSDGGVFENTDAFWGAYTGKTTANASFAPDIRDLVRSRPRGLLQSPTSENNEQAEVQDGVTGLTEWSWVFSLDNVSASFSGNRTISAGYGAGFRSAGYSVTAVSGQSYKTLIDKNLGKFTAVFAGGSDGFNITEKEPMLREGLLEDTTNSPYQTIQRAIDLLSDPEQLAFNIATVPGLKAAGLTKRLIERCEDRSDALAIIDVENSFVPPPERTATQASTPTSNSTMGDVTSAVSTFTDRQLDSSYGCAYYPWVQALDDNGRVVYLPPSVVALGVMSKTDASRGPWFAPAGFTRGGLSDGDAGIAVLNATEKLSSKDRDDLYEVGINPIASFPNEGVVIFGQKTLQADRSALDRINVRRMLIYVKSGLSQIAEGFLFEPNVQETWDKFLSRAEPFLTDVQQQFGIDEFKLVLDNTTTTPDLIDQNILYAKLFIKPTRAIEFIAVDFFITNSGASFED